MDEKKIEQQVIDSYQQDEQMMVLIFSQWCINNNLDPVNVYERAYPTQGKNEVLTQVLELTVSKEEAGPIHDDTLLNVLSLFGNEDLAFVVSEEIEKRNKK
ncbi:hypothetical protein [Alkalihalobacillus sp. LMS39]|uniref:hypothetical protein n=1 Tax=Alkalihalobacillus sp. LMS39 TaxID=2924032 RepID=UPI001FB1ABA8|nr:hypothetical protein [Alkalihalobacillus sp. LMS39]UOE92083.1 hypothetical protein MM271_12475 [Alkalihalobacillus sp. LMS39]